MSKNVEDFDWKKGELLTSDNGIVLDLAVHGYKNGEIGVGFRDKRAFVFEDGEGGIMDYRNFLLTLRDDFDATKGPDNLLYELPLHDEDLYFEVIAPGDGVNRVALEGMGLTDADIQDIEERLESLSDTYWQVIEQEF